MKRIQITLLVALLGSSYATSALAGNKAVNGMIIGAGSGAIIGQVAGQNTESVLVGTAVGGVVGYVLGSEMGGHKHTVVHHDNYRPVKHYDYYPPPRHNYSPAPRYYGKPFRPQHKYRSRDRICRETVRIHEHHGKRTRIVTSGCDNAYGRDWRRDGYR